MNITIGGFDMAINTSNLHVENKDSYLSSDLGYTRFENVGTINGWYRGLCENYPNTLYYARNYSEEWNAWRTGEVKQSNLILKQ